MNTPAHEPQPNGQGSAHEADHAQHDCRQYLGNLSLYVDGELSDELCQQIEAHMSECENCRVVVNTLSKTVTLYHQLPAPEMPNAVRERLYKVLDLGDFYTAPSDDEAGQGAV